MLRRDELARICWHVGMIDRACRSLAAAGEPLGARIQAAGRPLGRELLRALEQEAGEDGVGAINVLETVFALGLGSDEERAAWAAEKGGRNGVTTP